MNRETGEKSNCSDNSHWIQEFVIPAGSLVRKIKAGNEVVEYVVKPLDIEQSMKKSTTASVPRPVLAFLISSYRIAQSGKIPLLVLSQKQKQPSLTLQAPRPRPPDKRDSNFHAKNSLKRPPQGVFSIGSMRLRYLAPRFLS